jgi:hypothetical protein
MAVVEILVEDADKAILVQGHEQEEEVDDWSQFEPPNVLSELNTITSEIIIDIVQSSLANVRHQVELEKKRAEQLRIDAERAEQEAQAEEATLSGKGKQRADDVASVVAPSIDERTLSSTVNQAEGETPKAQKRGLFGLRRRLHRYVETKGETSQAGALGAERAELRVPVSPGTEGTSALSGLFYKHKKYSRSSDLVDTVLVQFHSSPWPQETC